MWPGVEETLTTFLPMTAFIKDDLPTLGWPTQPIVSVPSRNRTCSKNFVSADCNCNKNPMALQPFFNSPNFIHTLIGRNLIKNIQLQISLSPLYSTSVSGMNSYLSQSHTSSKSRTGRKYVTDCISQSCPPIPLDLLEYVPQLQVRCLRIPASFPPLFWFATKINQLKNKIFSYTRVA